MCRKLPFEKLVLHESTRSNDSSNLHTMYRETAKNEKNWSWQLATSAWYTCTAFYAWVYSIIVPILSVYWLPPRPSYLPIIHFQLHLYIYIYLEKTLFPQRVGAQFSKPGLYRYPDFLAPTLCATSTAYFSLPRTDGATLKALQRWYVLKIRKLWHFGNFLVTIIC